MIAPAPAAEGKRRWRVHKGHSLAGMRGSVRGTVVLQENVMEVSGKAPLKEIQSYHSRLKSLSGGEGSFTMDFSHYAVVTSQLQRELVNAFRGVTAE